MLNDTPTVGSLARALDALIPDSLVEDPDPAQQQHEAKSPPKSPRGRSLVAEVPAPSRISFRRVQSKSRSSREVNGAAQS